MPRIFKIAGHDVLDTREPDEIPPEEAIEPPKVECSTCCYFRAFAEYERQEIADVVTGDGWCLTHPPTLGVAQRVHPMATNTMQTMARPVHPIVIASEFCRNWRPAGEFAGSAEYAAADSFERVADSLEALVRYVREMVQTGGKSGDGLA